MPGNGIFPVQGPYDFGGKDARFGAARSGHIHQGQDVAAAEGTPLVAPKAGTIHWRAYQAGGAGYYLVLDADGEDFMYVFMHLRQGSLLVSKGDHVAAGQQIGQVGNTGSSSGPAPAFRGLAGRLVRRRSPDRPASGAAVLGSRRLIPAATILAAAR